MWVVAQDAALGYLMYCLYGQEGIIIPYEGTLIVQWLIHLNSMQLECASLVDFFKDLHLLVYIGKYEMH